MEAVSSFLMVTTIPHRLNQTSINDARRLIALVLMLRFFPDNESKYNRERFLSNWKNKQQLIALITDSLRLNGQNVFVCQGDADTKIVSTVLDVSKGETSKFEITMLLVWFHS